MALAAVQTAMSVEDKKAVHPFFSRPRSASYRSAIGNRAHYDTGGPPSEGNNEPHTANADSLNNDPEKPRAETEQPRQTRESNGPNKRGSRGGRRGRPSRRDVVHRENDAVEPPGESVKGEAPQEPTLAGVHASQWAASKKRKTESPVPSVQEPSVDNSRTNYVGTLDWHQQLQREAERNARPQPQSHESGQVSDPTVPGSPSDANRRVQTEKVPTTDGPSGDTKPHSINPDSYGSAMAGRTSHPGSVGQTTPKKRVLKVNKSGKLLSPKSPKPETSTTAARPGKRKRKTPKEKPNLTVVIRYGVDAASRQSIGRKIEEILNGKSVAVLPQPEPKQMPKKPSGPPKPTHPFFMAKQTKKEEKSSMITENVPVQLPPKSPKRTAVTPGKLMMESRDNHLSNPRPRFMSAFGDTRPAKSAGMSEAPWPAKECTHVRNIEKWEPKRQWDDISKPDLLKPRKLKGNPMAVPQDEDMLFKLARHLKPLANLTDPTDQRHVRLPERLLTSGVDIQERVRQELQSSPSTASMEELHTAIKYQFDGIKETLTPFDKGECESQSWILKYAPVSAAQVLQAGKEAHLLRDWLVYLTISSDNNSADLEDSKMPPKKRRKRMEDDFIVSDDDDGDELMEVSDGERYGGSCGSSQPKSLKRPRMSKSKNVFVLSGPHGCGKSATVYAVAKELGFEVFEINSGSRRSAKDIQDRVGDMSENHLVNHQRNDAKATPASTEDADMERMSKALQKDIDSGRQGTMASFFKSKPTKGPKAVTEQALKQPGKSTSISQSSPPVVEKRRRLQKQSLILFEEADVLFEEDQQFWGQVIKLAFQTKRPVVITCNNEDLIPAYALPLGAILRLSPPPVCLAADYLLTLAAKEGHILRRRAVCDLYKSRNKDLRATIAELDFWCQMSVGDRKGGLDWIYQRWPPGKDVDDQGRVIRVASEGTYQSGMGLLSHDVLTTADTFGFDKDACLGKELWADWGVTPEICGGSDIEAHEPESTPRASSSRLQELEELDRMLDTLSCVDVFCRVGLPTYDTMYEEPTDPSLPPRSDKERLDYTIDARFLQVDHMLDYTNFDTDISIQSHLGLQRAFGQSQTYQRIERSIWPGQDRTVDLILEQTANKDERHILSRADFSRAFDILGYPPATGPLSNSYPLTPSSFDRAFKIVVEDLAPFIRNIVSHELRLESERLRLGSLLSAGGSRRTRPRTTKASRVAVEGGTRQSKRRERWFDKDLNRELVMTTAGKSWAGLGSELEETEVSSRTGDSINGTQE